MKTTAKDVLLVTPAQTAETDDRRDCTRIKCQHLFTATFSYDEEGPHSYDEEGPQDTLVYDVSFAGIALLVTDVSRLAVGQKIDIAIRKHLMAAVIKYIVELPEGSYRVGTEFMDPSPQEVRALVEELLEL